MYSREEPILDSAVSNITKQLLIFPQEKIYLQTDKPYYISGEKIFFRAFLLDAVSNKQAALSRYVYVELIDPVDSVVQRVKIRRDSSYLFYGAIPLSEELAQGMYKLRSYTQYMRNQGDSSFFSKQVRIGDPQILKKQTPENSPVGRQNTRMSPEGDFDVSFYPEGGHLIAGQVSNVAFKALDSAGRAPDIKGEISDSKGNIVTELKTGHDGMGEFFLNPLPDEHYKAVCHHGNHTLQFDLPETQKSALALKVIFLHDKLFISINKRDSIAYPYLYLLIHSRGSIVYAKAWNPSNDYVALDSSGFPSGISHILLLTKDLQIVSERLVFLLNNDNGFAEFRTQKKIYKKREEVQTNIQLKDGNQQPLKGNFSISVTNDKEVIPDTTSSILSDILLSSELKGQIDNPEYYFQKGNKEAETAADLLMKIHGWTRYAIPDVIRGKLSYPQIPFEQSQEISGIVKSGLRSKPAKNFKVSMLSLNSGFSDITETDENGRYVFSNFEFPDSTKYLIQALNSKGKGRLMTELYINEDTFPGIHTPWIEPVVKEEKTDSIFWGYVAKADRQYMYEHGMRMINLPEVQIRGSYKKSSFHSLADYFTAKDIERLGITTGISLISRIPGTLLRRPIIMIDNRLLVENGDDFYANLNLINTNNIKQVFVTLNPGRSTFIAIYTKGADETVLTSDNIKPVIPLGYQAPVEFYSPKYDTKESIDNPSQDLRTTIYWKPNVITDNEGNAKLDFYTSDDPSTYSVVIEGVSDDGKLIHYRGKASIVVK